MKYVEVIAQHSSAKTIAAIAEKVKATDFRLGVRDDDGTQMMRFIVMDDQVQSLLDLLTNILGAQPTARITVMPIEVSLPRLSDDKSEGEDKAIALRESLYQGVAKGARLNANYILLLVLSTVVAAIGMIENNVAVIIGAMVIAPLLTPNLALSLGTALGDTPLTFQAIKTLLVGIAVAVALSIILGFLWPTTLSSSELLSRTQAELSAVALALASGAAAALSLTTGLSSVLVGVMVAVALLPPASTIGLMLGQGNFHLALGATLLLAINIVCVNLASKVVFYFKDIRPRKKQDKHEATKAMLMSIAAWVVVLGLLVTFIVWHRVES